MTAVADAAEGDSSVAEAGVAKGDGGGDGLDDHGGGGGDGAHADHIGDELLVGVGGGDGRVGHGNGGGVRDGDGGGDGDPMAVPAQST